MKQLRLEEVWRLLPPLDELRPVLDLLAAQSVPDPQRTWAVSGELDTVGGRLVTGEALASSGPSLVARVQEHLGAVYAGIGRALQALAGGQVSMAAEALLEVAALEEGNHRPERAEAYARSAFLLARDLKDQGPAGLALRRLGRALRAQGKLEEALGRYQEGLETALALGDPRGAAEAAVGAGNALEDQGAWDQAGAMYRRALTILEDGAVGPSPERWHALVNLHITLRSQGRLEESLPLLEAAETAAQEADDGGAHLFLENARGQLRVVQGEHAQAEAHFREALATAKSPAARVTVRLNLAEALLAQGHHLSAAEEAREAEMEALSAGVIPRLPEVYRLLGRVAAARGNPDAFVLFERALELVRERRLPAVEEARTLQAYAEAESRRGDPDAARMLLDRANELYRGLGIRHPRHPWGEFFGPSAPSDAEIDPSDRSGGNDG